MEGLYAITFHPLSLNVQSTGALLPLKHSEMATTTQPQKEERADEVVALCVSLNQAYMNECGIAIH